MSTLFALTLVSALSVLFNIYRYYFRFLPEPDAFDVAFAYFNAILAIVALFTGQFILFGSQFVVFVAEVYYKFGLAKRSSTPTS